MASDNKKKLVQSTLTSAFFSPKSHEDPETRSRYFSKPDPPTSPDPVPPNSASPSGALPPASSRTTDTSTATSPPPQPTQQPTTSSSPRTNTKRNLLLAHTAAETKALLPALLQLLPACPAHGYLYTPHNTPRLDHKYCPRFTSPSPYPSSSTSDPQQPSTTTRIPGTSIRVLNTDTLNAALALSSSPPPSSPSPTSTPTPRPRKQKPVLILNMANAHHPGGGWLRGALAQEESLCYRTSLSFSLKNRHYPLPTLGAIYSPTIVVLRDDLASGHGLLDLTRPETLPVVSVVSVAAVRDPEVVWAEEEGKAGREVYKFAADREAMKGKMRVVLRVAALNGHRRVVLGALGCGAFGNPRGEVVRCWREVLGEGEFGGGWWERVVFAVMDGGGVEGGGEGGREGVDADADVGKDGEGNFGVFWRGLDGLVV